MLTKRTRWSERTVKASIRGEAPDPIVVRPGRPTAPPGGDFDTDEMQVSTMPFSELRQDTSEVVEQVLGDWDVHDLESPEGLRTWLTKTRTINPATTPSEILKVVGEFGDVEPEGAWDVLGELVTGRAGAYRAPDVLARTVAAQVLDGDGRVTEEIRGYLGAGPLYREYRDALDRERLAMFGSPRADGPLLAGSAKDDTVKKLVDGQLRLVMGKLRPTVITRSKWTEGNSEQAAHDRLAWALWALKTSRDCVSLVTVTSEVHLFANQPDAGMDDDLNALITVANLGAKKAAAEIDKLLGRMVRGKLGERPKKNRPLKLITVEAAERRLRKVLHDLHANHKIWKDLRLQVHLATDGVHTETQAADELFRGVYGSGRQTEGPAAELRRDPETLRRLQARVRSVDMTIGISKLCCFKCWQMLQALGKHGVRMPATGTHLNNYEWPVPDSLTTPSMLIAFLGIPENPEDRSREQDDLLRFIGSRAGRAAVVHAISAFESSGGAKQTGYPSSEDDGVKRRKLKLDRAKPLHARLTAAAKSRTKGGRMKIDFDGPDGARKKKRGPGRPKKTAAQVKPLASEVEDDQAPPGRGLVKNKRTRSTKSSTAKGRKVRQRK